MSLFISSLPLFEHEQNGANHFTEELITRSETEPFHGRNLYHSVGESECIPSVKKGLALADVERFKRNVKETKSTHILVQIPPME